MSVSFPRRAAADIMDATFLARWADRETIGSAARTALREILDRLMADGGRRAARSTRSVCQPCWARR
jgi:hypothetical protein